MGVFLYRNYENTLSFVTVLIGMFQNIQDIAVLDMKEDLLKRNTAFGPQVIVLVGVPVKALHMAIIAQCVPNGINLEGCLTV